MNKKLIDALAAEFNVPADLLWFVYSCGVSLSCDGDTPADNADYIDDAATRERVRYCLGKLQQLPN